MTEADSDDDRSSDYDPQYVVLGESPSANRMRKKPRLSGRLVPPDSADGETQSEPEANTWYDEVLRSEGPPNRANTLPDLDIEWYRDRWSRSDYMSGRRDDMSEALEDDVESIRVNALICEIDENYIYSDDEYADVLRRIGEQEGVREYVEGLGRSQTSGAGPSGVFANTFLLAYSTQHIGVLIITVYIILVYLTNERVYSNAFHIVFQCFNQSDRSQVGVQMPMTFLINASMIRVRSEENTAD
ncbi:hypothetical protein RSAG8_09387, partial [Rhizoctonia solani AG-8 WAC10335]